MLKAWAPVVRLSAAFAAVALSRPMHSADTTLGFMCELLPYPTASKGLGSPAICRDSLARGTGAWPGDPRSFSAFRRYWLALPLPLPLPMPQLPLPLTLPLPMPQFPLPFRLPLPRPKLPLPLPLPLAAPALRLPL
ncbi:hypothetical protein EN745_03770 [Mesorhizobium sp. M4A.F.Ca.ET.022.05.2.1]|nr:hypothetical protein EN745_03770 [Mesorhizobium sp. M4A.F.Ca.ET.022.05.2.1]